MSVESAGNQSNEINGDELKENITLCTRAGTYQVNTEQESSGSNTTHSTPIASKKDFRHVHFLKCKNHCLAAPKWTKDNDECANCILFNSSPLPNRRLSTVKDVICYYFYLHATPAYHHQAADQDTATDIMNHWISCNVYTISLKSIVKRVSTLRTRYIYLKEYPKLKKKDKYWGEYNEFIEQRAKLFDIIGDDERIKNQENVWKVKMIEKDYKFYENMCCQPQLGYCSNVDKKWQRTEKRKHREADALEKRRAESESVTRSLKRNLLRGLTL